MSAYWWECEKCKKTFDFPKACDSKGMPHYIWDVLIPSDWNQAHLCIECPACRKRSLRIAYEFPRRDKESIRVIHIVGLAIGDDYVPMMWETLAAPYDGSTWFDFKYIIGRNYRGLNRPAVFERDALRKLFALYCKKTGIATFP